MDLADADIRAIAAVNKNGGIGINGKMPWDSNKGDLSFFRQQTENCIVIFGRKTVEATPLLQNLKFRKVYTWHRIPGIQRDPGAMLNHILRDYTNWPKPPTIWIAGGAQTYRTFAPWTKSLCLTPVDDQSECDTFFPFDAFFDIKQVYSKCLNKKLGEQFESWDNK